MQRVPYPWQVLPRVGSSAPLFFYSRPERFYPFSIPCRFGEPGFSRAVRASIELSSRGSARLSRFAGV